MGLMPSGVTIWSRTGERITMMGVVCTNIPAMNSRTKIRLMITTGLVEMLKKKFCTISPKPWYTNTALSAPATAMV